MKKQIIFTSVVTALITSITTGAVVAQTTQRFPDVPTDAWYYSAVNNLNDWDVIRGNDDGTFNPNGQVNRAQLAVMWDRYDERVSRSIDFTGNEIFKTMLQDNTADSSDLHNTYILMAMVAHDAGVSCELVWDLVDFSELAHDQSVKWWNDTVDAGYAMDLPLSFANDAKSGMTRCYK